METLEPVKPKFDRSAYMKRMWAEGKVKGKQKKSAVDSPKEVVTQTNL